MQQTLLASLALACLAHTGGAQTSQETAPEATSQPVAQKPKLPSNLKQRFKDPFLNLVPGRLPEGVSIEAATLFESLSRATLAPGAERKPLVAFDLLFEIITRGPGVERNQAEVRVRFQKPSFVRFAIGKEKEMGFGSKGYWQRFEDGAKLLNGRDYGPDRKRILEIKSVAKNFLVLADPRQLRLQSLRVLTSAPPEAPTVLIKRTKELAWIEIESPDFALAQKQAEKPTDARLFRATLGLDPATGRVLEAFVQELDKHQPKPATSMWVSLSNPMKMGASQLPGTIEVRYPALGPEGWAIQAQVREAMYLLEGKLNPMMPKDTFDPPRR